MLGVLYMDIINKKNILKKEIFRTYMLIYIGILLTNMMSETFGGLILFMFNSFLSMLELNMINRGLIISLFTIGIKMLPVFPLVIGEIRLYDLTVQSNEVERELEIYSFQMRELELGIDEITIQDIVERVKILPRSKQIEILNYVKDLSLNNSVDTKKYLDIESLDKESLDLLISEIDDILYPSYDSESEKGYTRKKTKNDNSITY